MYKRQYICSPTIWGWRRGIPWPHHPDPLERVRCQERCFTPFQGATLLLFKFSLNNTGWVSRSLDAADSLTQNICYKHRPPVADRDAAVVFALLCRRWSAILRIHWINFLLFAPLFPRLGRRLGRQLGRRLDELSAGRLGRRTFQEDRLSLSVGKQCVDSKRKLRLEERPVSGVVVIQKQWQASFNLLGRCSECSVDEVSEVLSLIHI